MGGEKKVLVLNFLLVFVILFSSTVFAADYDQLITNSDDWKDVFSGIHYSTLEGISGHFMTSVNHGNILANGIEDNSSVLVVSSTKSKFISNYDGFLESSGIENVTEISSRNLNVELAKDMNLNNFIFVDPSYGYAAISVAPYAVKSNSWVFFVDESTIDDVDSVLSEMNVENALVYGYIEKEAMDVLEKYDLEIINNEDRFQDNIDIVKKYRELNPTNQIILTNGDYMEREFMIGSYPIIFTGAKTVPEKIADYLIDSDFSIGVLVGNELVEAATNIRSDTGMYVIVKFARGARGQNSGIASVEGLDLFPVPSPVVNVSIYSVYFNKYSNNLEVVYRSTSNVPVYLRSEISIAGRNFVSTDGQDTFFVSPNEYKTISYELEKNQDPLESYEDLIADFYLLYGESTDSLDRILSEQLEISVVEIQDRCELDILSVKYNKQDDVFKVKVKNTANVNCYADVSVVDFVSDYEDNVLHTQGVTMVEGGKTGNLIIEEEISLEDLENNEIVDVLVSYGEKETNLVKTISGEFELTLQNLTAILYVAIGVFLLMLVFIFLFLQRRKKEEEFDF